MPNLLIPLWADGSNFTPSSRNAVTLHFLSVGHPRFAGLADRPAGPRSQGGRKSYVPFFTTYLATVGFRARESGVEIR